MSMFNDIEWKKNDENCISNADQVKNYSNRFLSGHWTFLGPGSERSGTVAQMMDNGTVQPTKWYSNSKKLVILIS